MADLVLPPDDSGVGQFGAQRDALLRADGRQYQGPLRDARNAAEQKDGRLQRAEEQPRSGKEEVACMDMPAQPGPRATQAQRCAVHALVSAKVCAMAG